MDMKKVLYIQDRGDRNEELHKKRGSIQFFSVYGLSMFYL
jgi:hypothetical protein